MSKFRVSVGLMLLGTIVLIAIDRLTSYQVINYLILLFLLEIVYIGIMSMSIRSNFFLTAIHHTSDNQVMLTFDDGPCPQYTPRILDILKEKGIKASFFLIGTQIEKYPDIVRRIIKEGHAIGGHSYNHKRAFGFTLGADLENEIMKTQQLLSALSGQQEMLFRPPFGVTNPKVARAVRKYDLRTVGWSVRSFDTVAKKKDQILSKVLGEVKPGSIVLLHDTVELTADVLTTLIDKISAKGLEFGLLKEE